MSLHQTSEENIKVQAVCAGSVQAVCGQCAGSACDLDACEH